MTEPVCVEMDRRFAKIALGKGYICKRTLESVMTYRRFDTNGSHPPKTLPCVFIERRLMSHDQVDRVLNQMFSFTAQ